jgi:hypothetical protein
MCRNIMWVELGFGGGVQASCCGSWYFGENGDGRSVKSRRCFQSIYRCANLPAVVVEDTYVEHRLFYGDDLLLSCGLPITMNLGNMVCANAGRRDTDGD